MSKFTLMGLGAKNNSIPYELSELQRNYSFNTGNLLFHYASEKIADLSSGGFSWGSRSEVINSDKNTKGVLLPMANQLGSHVNLLEQGPKLVGVDKPIIVIGLGAQFELENDGGLDSISQGTIDWLNIVTNEKKNKNITVRGQFTANLLDRLGFNGCYEVLGCPSMLINPSDNLGAKLKEKFFASNKEEKLNNLAIAAGNPFINELANLERNLIELVDTYHASYIVQHPKLLIELSMAYEDEGSNEKFDVVKNRWFKEKSESEIKRWFVLNSTTYVSVAQWFSDLRRKDFVLGTRIHGIQAAIQSGTPAVCLYIDSRTKELCETMGLPCMSALEFKNDFDLDRVFKVFENWDENKFDNKRKVLSRKMLNFLKHNNVSPSKHLIELAK